MILLPTQWEETTAGFIHRVTATTPNGAPTIGVRFRADAVDDARQAKLEIVSGDGQSAGKGDPLEAPLVVRVRNCARISDPRYTAGVHCP